VKTMALVALIWTAALPAAATEDALTTAKNLYASAAYEDALATLSRAAEAKTEPPDIARQIDKYRAFCLYALGRLQEGDVVVESLVRSDPSLQLNADEVSPRLAARFTNVRKRLLPSLIRDSYRAGKSALDAKKYAEAEPQLAQARRLLADAEQLGDLDPSMIDLRMLVDGFLELAHSAAAAQRQAATINVASAEPAKAPATPAPAAQPTPQPASAQTSAAAAQTSAPAEVNTIADADVSPPVALQQTLPAAPPALATIMRRAQAQGIVDVVISENGSVEDAIIRRSINAAYDELLIEAARRWKYRPALKSGVPVRYTKTILVRAQ
jgi:TonB family protein